MNDETDEDIGKLMDKHIENLDPEIRKYLIKKAFEEYRRILWMERDGDKWNNCFDCQHFNALKSDKKGTKIFLKKGFWGYCLNSNHTMSKKKKGSPRIHIIYMDNKDDPMVKLGLRSPCYKPKTNKENNFFNMMIKQEEDNITKLLMESSLTEEERKYFTDLKKKYQE